MFSLATARTFILLSLVAALALTGAMYSLRSNCETQQTEGSPSPHCPRSGIQRNFPAAKHHQSTVLHSRKILISMQSSPKKLPVAVSILSPRIGRSMAFIRPEAAQQAHKKAAHHRKSSRINTSSDLDSVTAPANPSLHSLKVTKTTNWINRERQMKKDSLKNFYEDHAFHVDYSRPGAHPPHNH